MGLTGIQIYKLLPKTNCGECGVPTCLAFAMALAAGKAELSSCPYVSEEAKEQLSEASAPPIRAVVIGTGDEALKIGGETVLFRHEKTFFNPPGIGLVITDEMSGQEVEAKMEALKGLKYERVGLTLKPNIVGLKCTSGDHGKFQALIENVSSKVDLPIVLMSKDPKAMEAALKVCSDKRPLLYAATSSNASEMAELAKANNCPLAVRGKDLDEVASITEKLSEDGIKDMVIDSGAREAKRALEDQIIIRRAALMSKFRPLGFPTITLPCEMTDDYRKETVLAATFIAKYGGIILMSDLRGEGVFPLLVARMNIYTDPQRPMATSPGIYEINGPDETSPMCVTSNFSLTYFIVSGEIESSRVPTWLVVMDTEGLSVMTAWAAGKFVGDAIGIFMKKCGAVEKVKHKKVIIPGYAAAISGDLEEELGDWEVLVGPREASVLPSYLKEWRS
jgi:acetyl-CoA decarbonylase/synthase complex subunit gamma